MTKRDDQILPPSTLRAVDEWERESEMGAGQLGSLPCDCDETYGFDDVDGGFYVNCRKCGRRWFQRNETHWPSPVGVMHEQNRILFEHDQRERNAKPARPDLYPSHVGVSTMTSPAERTMWSHRIVAVTGALMALAVAFAAGWGAVELVRWVVE